MVEVDRTPNVWLTSSDVSRLTREVMACGRDAYRVFRKQHLDGKIWRPLLRDVPYEDRDAAGNVVERGRKTMLSRARSHDLEDIWERELGIVARVSIGNDGVRRVATVGDV